MLNLKKFESKYQLLKSKVCQFSNWKSEEGNKEIGK